MTRDLRARLDEFLKTPIAEVLDAPGDPAEAMLALFREVADGVPAYQQFLAAQGIAAEEVRSLADFQRLPLLTRENYLRRYPLASRCRGGTLAGLEIVAMSSGSTGEPTPWPRGLVDELQIAARFEQVFFDNFAADRRSTLAVVCFPLGTWIGGMYTASCCRHLAAKGYPLITVTPGNQKPEIYRVLAALAGQFEQVVLLGYPPFLKDVIDGGAAAGIDWQALRLGLVLAGEVVSEDWKALMTARAGLERPLFAIASLYGTADAGVLANETPLAAAIRGWVNGEPEHARALFGEARLPTLAQYDPRSRYFEAHDGTLLFSGDNGVPLVRYHISDQGGIVGYEDMLAFCRARGFDPIAAVRDQGDRGVHALPFVYVFGRSHFAVSFYGANVFPEMVAIGLEQPEVSPHVTGKFVMEVVADGDHGRELRITVELAEGVQAPAGLEATVAAAILASLRRLSSEFAAYAPPERQLPRVTLLPARDPGYFPVGVKHRYSR